MIPPLELHSTGERQLFTALNQLADAFSNLKPIIEDIGVAGLEDTQHRFDVAGPGWPPHAESTRKKKIGPQRLLRASDTLYGSFKKDAPQNIFRVDARSGVFGSSVFYGIFHQEGRGHNPVRVIVDPSEHEAKYEQFLVDGLNERIREAGFTVN